MSQGISRHDEVFKYLKTFQLKNDRLPSSKEAMYDLKIGRVVLYRVLDRLEQAGKLEKIPSSILPYRLK